VLCMLLLCGAGVPALLGGCHSPEQAIEADPWAAMQDPHLAPDSQARAVPVAWARARDDAEARAEALGRFEDIYWGRAALAPTRLAIIETLSTDADPEVLEWIRTTMRRSLPVEDDRHVVAYIGAVAAERGWTDFTGPLIRALANPLRGTPIEQRSEYKALRRLHPDRSVMEVAFEVFIDPGEPDPGLAERDLDLAGLTRRDAWDVLSRLDPDASARREMIRAADREGHPQLDALRAALDELGIVPFNGPELDWLMTLRDEEADLAWWARVGEIVGSLPKSKAGELELRHLEPLRWAGEFRPAWLEAERGELLHRLRERQASRSLNRRTADRVQPDGGPNRERVDDWVARLSWADLVALLVVDLAVRDRGVGRAVLEHARLDAEDESTEYGGMIVARSDGSFEARLYPPRPSERFGDFRFVASDELLSASDTALAHYHLQVQDSTRRAKAGPSRADLLAAARLGRTSVVFTSIGGGVLGVDGYQPDGVVIDLGEIRRE